MQGGPEYAIATSSSRSSGQQNGAECAIASDSQSSGQYLYATAHRRTLFDPSEKDLQHFSDDNNNNNNNNGTTFYSALSGRTTANVNKSATVNSSSAAPFYSAVSGRTIVGGKNDSHYQAPSRPTATGGGGGGLYSAFSTSDVVEIGDEATFSAPHTDA